MPRSVSPPAATERTQRNCRIDPSSSNINNHAPAKEQQLLLQQNRQQKQVDMEEDSGEFARVNRVVLAKSSDEYRQRRERNNAAVKKSRFKSKQKTLETQKRVDQLKEENSNLETRVQTLKRELAFMKAIFVPRRDSQQSTQFEQ